MRFLLVRPRWRNRVDWIRWDATAQLLELFTSCRASPHCQLTSLKCLMTVDPHSSHSHYGFRPFARWVSNAAGKPSAFALSVAVVLIWAASGPLFHFSDTWQLVINTGTTVVTFWMVFVIQSSQNNDTHALQLKLDELIRATDSARNVFLGCEGLPDEAMRAF